MLGERLKLGSILEDSLIIWEFHIVGGRQKVAHSLVSSGLLSRTIGRM